MHPIPLLTLSTLLLTSSLSAQIVGGGFETKIQLDGTVAFEDFGTAVSGAGDVNADGTPDFIVGVYKAAPGGLSYAGSAFVYSGATGQILHQFDGQVVGDFLGSAVCGAGDIDQDGHADIIIGAHNADSGINDDLGSVFVYSGATGAEIYRFDGPHAGSFFGEHVAGAGDVNNDGYPDILIGARYALAGGVAKGVAFVYSGADGGLLHQIDGINQYDNFGGSVSITGDLDGDGFDDLLIGAPAADPFGFDGAGTAYAYSGATGALLYQMNGTAEDDILGTAVSGIGDLNADGSPDYLVSARGADPNGVNAAGSVFAHSGADGSLLFQINGEAAGFLIGDSVSSAGDMDKDGTPDILIGAAWAEPNGSYSEGSAYIYSGANGAFIHRFENPHGNGLLGYVSDGIGDIDGDGYPEVIAGASFADFGGLSNLGSVFVFGVDPYLHASSDTVSAGSATLLTLELDFPDSAAWNEYKVLFSATGNGPFHFGVDVPLTVDNMVLHCYFNNYPFPYTAGVQATLNGNGDGIAAIGFPANSFSYYIGRTFWVAAITNKFGKAPEFSSVSYPIQVTL